MCSLEIALLQVLNRDLHLDLEEAAVVCDYNICAKYVSRLDNQYGYGVYVLSLAVVGK